MFTEFWQICRYSHALQYDKETRYTSHHRIATSDLPLKLCLLVNSHNDKDRQYRRKSIQYLRFDSYEEERLRIWCKFGLPEW